jgi:hypothetical protein
VADIISVDDLPSAIQANESVDLLVAGANAKASRVAPCLTWDGSEEDEPAPSDDQLAEAKLVLIGAVKRWSEVAAGAYQQQTAGPFGVTLDTRQRTGFNLWPSEIEGLQDICASGTDSSTSAFSITPGAATSVHLAWCNLNFGSTYCSCGADLTNYAYPLFEGGVLSDDHY